MLKTSDMDPYEALGIVPTATAAEIRRAYRRKALQCHPDRGGTHGQMERLNRAYALLSDPVARRDYDLQRRPPRPPSPPASRRTGETPSPKPPRRGRSDPGGDTPLINTAGAVARRLAFWTGRALGKVAKLFH